MHPRVILKKSIIGYVYLLKGGAKKSKGLFPVVLLLFLSYYGFWWLYKLDVLPGLHGDEAWFGLKADEFSRQGIHHLYGMNTYTGILQPLLAWFSFKTFNIGVFQLRAGGVFFNLLALLIISAALYRNKLKKTLLIFLLVISQSGLYLISARVAWEVNTFTLFFISLLIYSGLNIIKDINKPRNSWVLLFLLTNILGTYNHVLFSCISIAALAGLALWSLLTNSIYYKSVIVLLSLNLINLILVFLAMQYWLGTPFFNTWYAVIPVTTLLLMTELFVLKSLVKLPAGRSIAIPPVIVKTLLLLACIRFAAWHGMALFQVFSTYKLLIHAYSYQPGMMSTLLFVTGGCIFAFYLCWFLLKDTTGRTPASPFACVIVAYFGLLPFYTTNCSFRYYLSIYAIIGLYMATKAGKNMVRSIPLLTSLAATLVLLNIMLVIVFTSPNRPLRAMDFIIGNNQVETSAHFLPNKPLIDFLKINQVGDIKYPSEQYFLEQPVLFYKLVAPWKTSPYNKAIIDYDFTGYKQGFMLYKEN